MAVTAQGSGTITATVSTTTDDVLLNVAVAGTFTFHVDTINMAAGDVVELRIYQIILTGGTRRVAYLARYADAQPADDIIKISVPIANELTDSGSLRFALRQTFGTGRSYPW